MAFSKITDQERLGKGNVGQPDTPLLTTTEMQEQMDSLPNLGIDGFNRFIDEITDKTAAQNIGCEPPSGITAQNNIKAIFNSIVLDYANAKTYAHTHQNKQQLDIIDVNFIAGVGSLISMLAAISRVDPYIDVEAQDLSSGLPTSLAVKNFLEGYNYKSIIKDQIYPIGSIYQTTLVSPDIIFGTTGAWQLLSTDENGVKTYKRLS